MPNQGHSANPAMTFLFHINRDWRGVADGQRSAEIRGPCVELTGTLFGCLLPLRTWRPLRAAESEILTQRAPRTQRVWRELAGQFAF